ncbi:MAG: glycerol uptake operon antiterminator [Erysipelotrichaceae bacterium]|nr:MAG: glycerol uptake operon [Erysipelotrichaceae bacterium]TXT16728.1 MAG: glycerol uptake operon antiterminator [Erysipelotrichaceae bacterium]
MISKQNIIPVITSMKGLEAFLRTSLKVFILQDVHINHLKDMIKMAHEAKKEVIVHIELIQGLANDEFGAQFLIQQLHVDGLISSKPKIIEMTQKNRCLGILRVFIMDSKSIKRSLQLIEAIKPDVVEFLPALIYEVFPTFINDIKAEVWAGGLVQTPYQIQSIFASGIKRITLSNLELAIKYAEFN